MLESLLEGRLELGDILGSGVNSVTYLATDVITEVRYAVKRLSKFNADGSELEHREAAYLRREIRLHFLVSAHPNVVSIHRVVDSDKYIYVILEYCPEGDLFVNITERHQYIGNDTLSKKTFLQILSAVEHCHALGVYHRDLKPENIFVMNLGGSVKLGDFGLATSHTRSDTGCGTPSYMSPESLDYSTGTGSYMCAPSDIWSLGVTLINLTCGSNPWKLASVEDLSYREFVGSPENLRSILPLSKELSSILCSVFALDPEQRITLPDLRDRITACSNFTTAHNSR